MFKNIGNKKEYAFNPSIHGIERLGTNYRQLKMEATMLYSKSDSNQYVWEFKRRFTNFCEKCPLLLSFTTTPGGIQLIDETLNDIYEISWDFSIPVKSFIFGIKNLLITNNRYPVIHEVIEKEIPISSEEQIQMAISGTPIETIPIKTYKKYITPYRIDKLIVFKDIFILENLNTGERSRWHLKKSSIFFLKKMRQGKLTKEEAGTYFFNNAELMNVIILKDEDFKE